MAAGAAAEAAASRPRTACTRRLPRPRLVAELLTLLPPPEAYTVRLFAFSLTACCVLGGSGNSPNTIILVSCILVCVAALLFAPRPQGQHVAVEPLMRCILERDIPQPKQSEVWFALLLLSLCAVGGCAASVFGLFVCLFVFLRLTNG